jgi:uncharacterized membrane protein YcaP (DUF421 family)
MLQTVWDNIQVFLGYDRKVEAVNAIQMALRTIIVYAVTLVLIRIGSQRFLSQATAFDVVIGIMLGSVMSRAINGSAPLFPTLLAGVAFIGLHWLLNALAFRTTGWFGPIVKGKPVLLIKDGKVQQQGMREIGFSTRDLEEALRLQGEETDPSKIKLAYMERNGSVSVIPRPSEPRIVDVSVTDGVQTVRIELE